MAALDFSDLAAMALLVTERTGGLAPSDLENKLEESAATHTSGAVTVYRPYYVAAVLLDSQLNTRRLREAKGTVFDAPSKAIRGLMREQAAFDAKYADQHSDYTVPEGYESESGSSQVVF